MACGVEDEPSYGAKLLTDIREAFEESGGHRMSSADLTAALVGMPDRPWCECNHGKALTQNGLANRLRKFGIRTKTLRAKGEQSKCYEAEAFADAFARYCPDPGVQAVPPYQVNNINDLGKNQCVPCNLGGTDQNQSKPLKSLEWYGGTAQNPPDRQCAHVPDENDGLEGLI